MRVLVAYEEAYRSYRDAIVRAIRDHRPHFTALGTTPQEFESALERFEPDAVVSSHPSVEYQGGGRRRWWSYLPNRPKAVMSAWAGTTMGRLIPTLRRC